MTGEDVSTKFIPKSLLTPKNGFKKLVEAPAYDVLSKGLSENTCKRKSYFARPEVIEE